MSGHLQWRPTGSDLGWVVIHNMVFTKELKEYNRVYYGNYWDGWSFTIPKIFSRIKFSNIKNF